MSSCHEGLRWVLSVISRTVWNVGFSLSPVYNNWARKIARVTRDMSAEEFDWWGVDYSGQDGGWQLPKRAAELHEKGRRKRGRQMLRWEDRVKRDVKKVGEEEDWKKTKEGWKDNKMRRWQVADNTSPLTKGSESEVKWSEVKWSEVKWSEVNWSESEVNVKSTNTKQHKQIIELNENVLKQLAVHIYNTQYYVKWFIFIYTKSSLLSLSLAVCYRLEKHCQC